MIGNKAFDCAEMFRHACAFCECADLAREKFSCENVDIEFLTVPSNVNSAFACEIFLKTILKIYDVKYVKGHELKKLFDNLPKELQDYVKQYFVNLHLWKDGFGIENLAKISKTFQKWRYIYEHDFRKGAMIQIESGFLNMFRNLLREICCKELFSRSWEEYKKSVWG